MKIPKYPSFLSFILMSITLGFGFILNSDEKKILSASISIAPNFRIYPSSITQSETFITKSPINPQLLFVTANTINLSNGFISEGIYVSTNGGLNWRGDDTCTGTPINFHRGDPGIAIDKNGVFVLTRLGLSPGLFSHYSTDNGLTWSNQKTILNEDQDRASTTSDPYSSSPFYGRVYTAWVKFAPPYPTMVAYTDNGAQTWSTPLQINNPPQRCQGGDVIVGNDGKVYLTWAGVINSSPFTEDKVGFAVSSNGGGNWTVTEEAYDMNGINGLLPQKGNIRVNGLPSIDVDASGGTRNGWIYITTGEKNLAPAGTDPDIVLHRSTNGGQTWSAGVRVNQDPINNGKIQFFPAIHVDDEGGINIIYYDDRNTTSDSSQVYLSRSTDGGFTFKDYQISDHSFKPSPIGGLGQGYQGDNIDINSIANILIPVWMDNSSGIYQIWTSRIDRNTLSISQIGELIPEKYNLLQNYPNPFNGVSNIKFSIPNVSDVALKVYDLNGKEIEILYQGKLSGGNYKVQWNSNTLPSGVYFYSLFIENKLFDTKKMVLVK
jgi:hypothetical protein